MRYLQSTLPLLFAVILFGSCKKEHITDNNPVVEEHVPILKGKKLVFTNIYGDYDATFKYNSDSTPSEMILYPHGYTDEVSKITYALPKITTLMTRNDVKTYESVVTIKNGKIDTEDRKYFKSNGDIVQQSHIINYNNQGLISEITYDAGFKYKYTYNNEKDLILRKLYDGETVLMTTEYEYENKIDKFPYFGLLVTDNYGIFRPAFSVHLVKHIKTTENNVVKTDKTIQYVLDAEGYVVSGVTTDQLTQNTFNWYNTYE